MRWVVLAVLAACGTTSTTKDRPAENIAFATSTVHSANLGGLDGADAICNELADAAGLGGTYVAWLSTTTTNAFSRIENGVGWVAIDGTPIAATPTDLVTGSMVSPIAYDERGHDVRPTQSEVWTGTLGDGTYSGSTCMGWTIEDPTVNADVGAASAGSTQFTHSAAASCAAPRRFYCFETDRTTPVVVPAPTGRRAFITSAVWQPNAGGIGDADLLCQNEAAAAALPGTYLALLPNGTATAASRFDTSGAPWTTATGIPLSETADRLFTADFLHGFINTQADGTHAIPTALAWCGDPVDAKAGAACADWTMPVASAVSGSFGDPHESSRRLFASAGAPCDFPGLYLYCLQQ
jgi:hypothetical protein